MSATVSESWEEKRTFTKDGVDPVFFTVSSKGNRGPGVLTASVDWSWDSYDGFPAIFFGDQQTESHSYGAKQPSLIGEVALSAGESADFAVDEWAKGADGGYPLEFTVTFTWQDRMDCFEDNSFVEDAKELSLDETVQAYMMGSMYESGEEYRWQNSDDFYKITVPEGASTLTIDLSFSSTESTVRASIDDELGFVLVGGEFGYQDSLVIDVSPGTYTLFVESFDGPTFQSWTNPTEDGSLRPDEWDVPYTFFATLN